MRKTEIVKITDEGRDKGKVFVLTEMPASRSEKWATRALLALAKSGVDLPTSVAGSGFAGIAVAGVKALNGLAFADAEPLMDEMFGCIEIRTAPDVVRPLVEDDIEEVMTRLKLRVNVLELHMGFFYRRRPLEISGNDTSSVGDGLYEYQNVPCTLATVISRGKATLHELDTVYGLEDVYDMLEVLSIDAHNQNIINARNR